jgi:hypothetical protein
MTRFFHERGLWLAAVVLIMFGVSLAQAGISYTIAFGALSGLLPKDRSAIATVLLVVRFGLVALMAVMWVARRKRAAFRVIVIANALFTIALLTHTAALVAVLFGSAWEAVNTLMLDVMQDHHSGWRDHQHSSERTSPIPKQEQATGETAVLVLTSGARRVLQRSWRSRRDADDATTPTR